jgi:dUTP pyrophosphatase
MIIKIKKLSNNAVVPQYQSKGAAGFDFHTISHGSILPGGTVLIPTGLSMEIPRGYELQVRPRSGMSAKTKIRICNSPGTIDSDYRGEIKIIMENIGTTEFKYAEGERIAQGVITEVYQAEFELAEELNDTERGTGAFGSTGTK